MLGPPHPRRLQGTVQCDGYAAYPSFAKQSGGRITLAACWAHARRKFHKAAECDGQSHRLHPDMLLVYLEDGRVEIDNNLVENAIRPTAIGKKNYPSLRSGSAERLRCGDAAVAAGQWLFGGEAEAGQRSAILFTIIEACRSRGIDPQSYMRNVLTRLPTLTRACLKTRGEL